MEFFHHIFRCFLLMIEKDFSFTNLQQFKDKLITELINVLHFKHLELVLIKILDLNKINLYNFHFFHIYNTQC